ncbi:MAG TPA: MFS transporter [Candidatus Didemnitutus sp.]|nr:MFS transporter [Candidatus Didemnitutus sp.]
MTGTPQGYNRFLLLVAGLGGLLYGVDVGIIASAYPYLEATANLSRSQLSFVVAAVLLGSVFSTLFAGLLADWMGRKKLMIISGLFFVASIPIIALAPGYGPLVAGRLLQGMSGGFIGVVVPLYLAECLSAESRGKGTGIFQWLLTGGIVVAALIGVYFSQRVDEVSKVGTPEQILAYKDTAWRSIFWVSLPPGILFVFGSFIVSESPRWLFRHGRKEEARAALLRSRTSEQSNVEFEEMGTAETNAAPKAGTASGGSLLQRRYVVPFVMACVILACNQATGVNSIIGYNTDILLQGGLSDVQSHSGYLILTLVNFAVTMAGVALVDRKGRKFLLSRGSAGVIVSLLFVAVLFHRNEAQAVDCAAAVQAEAGAAAKVTFTPDVASRWLAGTGAAGLDPTKAPVSLVIIYSYGDFRTATKVVRSDDRAAPALELSRESCLPMNRVVAFFSNPWADLEAARHAPLRIEHARITPIPSLTSGWLTAIGIFAFMASFAIGPGVCVWLALSELMPTRIRSNGMSIALLINQAVSTVIAAAFLPTVGQLGYSTMFFGFAACTVVYFITATFFLPETKGKTLEEIETIFSQRKRGT